MYKPLACFIGLRYMRAKKNNRFVSFISLSSMLGIAMGVMVLVTVLSVMNGFHAQIYKNFFGMAPEITITASQGVMDDWVNVAQKIQQEPGIKAVAPFAGEQGLLTYEGQVSPIILNGIVPDKEEALNHLSKKLFLGSIGRLEHFGIILGRGVAEKLGVMLGDKVTVVIPKASMTATGMVPRFRRFTVVGMFSVGPGFGFDNNLAFVNLSDAQKLLDLGESVTGLKLKINEVHQAPQLAALLATQLGEHYQVGNWTEQYGAFFQAVRMEKTMMFFVLVLIIAVAAFNLVSSLVMVVHDKQAEIAILRTMGATPGMILSIFMVEGMMVGVMGTLMGLIGGLILATNAAAIVDVLQGWLHTAMFSYSLYGAESLPSKILWQDLWRVSAMALLLSFLATIYPAWRASKTLIAEALHYE